MNCTDNVKLRFEWKVYLVSPGEASGGYETIVNNKSAEWSIKPHALTYGIYVVRFITHVTGSLNATSSDFGFLNITKTPLEAHILGGSSLTRGFNKLQTLDASLSRDPDVGPGDHSGLRFVWLCRKVGEPWPSGEILSLPNVSLSPTGNNTGGCFGTGIGKLSGKSKFTINTGNMMENQDYEFKVVVMKGERRSESWQTIKVVAGDPPEIIVRWVILNMIIYFIRTWISIHVTLLRRLQRRVVIHHVIKATNHKEAKRQHIFDGPFQSLCKP